MEPAMGFKTVREPDGLASIRVMAILEGYSGGIGQGWDRAKTQWINRAVIASIKTRRLIGRVVIRQPMPAATQIVVLQRIANVPTDEKMIRSLEALGQQVEACPILHGAASLDEQLRHKAGVRLWRAHLFMQWQLACVPRASVPV
jgi:hypothetical protein